MKILYLTMDGYDTAGPNNQMSMVMIREFTKHGYECTLFRVEERESIRKFLKC